MNKFEQQAVTLALKVMFEGNYFDICTIDRALKIAKCIPNKADYESLHVLHCIHWSKMTPEFRQEVFQKTMELFVPAGFDLSMVVEEQTKRTLVQRLLS